MVEISAEAVVKVFYPGWISRFGPPLRLTTDQGTQFEASLFNALSKFLGTEKRHTTPYHPAANSQVERFHRQLKVAIMAHGSSQWTTVLPSILMGFRATWKEDLQATAAEMIYGAPLSGFQENFYAHQNKVQILLLLWGETQESMQRLSPPTTQHHGQHTIFVSKDLATCSHVFLRTDSSESGSETEGKKCPFNQRTLQNSNKIVVGKKPQPVPAAEYVSIPSIAKNSLSLVGATCGGYGMLLSRDDIGRGEEPKREPKEEVKRVGRDAK
ncbi:retrovirus-related Pol polyprotein from transposon 412 [Trichonephila clavipes]|nr:retrovirus-related Pol polyprotein from transposon 412 [Trichonephila clavipes]